MSFEPGGRSDKYGNEYENRFFAKLLLRVVKESLFSVVVEPVGDNSDSVEFITKTKEGHFEYYQCKASNNTKTSWSINDLERHKVFTRAKKILSDDTAAHYFFISPLPYNELDELCKRARTTPSAKALVDFQLNNSKIQRTFEDSAKAFGLDVSNAQDVDTFVSLLSRCYFERHPDGVEAVRDLEEMIGLMFTGNASGVRDHLESYANSRGIYGTEISAKHIVDYLEGLGIYLRSMSFDERCLPRINTLNNTYWDVCPAINGKRIHREAASKILQRIKEGGSVILHGKAGSGKSGCLQETIELLRDNHILYLAVKLDKTIPETSADRFGQQLELPQSPVCCLAALAGEAPCVLILDQLDALRWTMGHSAAALCVCKELIRQADALNKYEEKRVSIVFASRTFDLENDGGLKSLFIKENKQNSLDWDKISVNDFTQDEVVQLIGDTFHGLPSRLQRLLLTPSTLYVWTQLEESRRTNSVSSVHQLMSEWWTQILESSELKGIAQDKLIKCNNAIVSRMEKNARFSLPVALFPNERQALSVLISSGMIRENGNSISFVHQSFLDYFITSDYLSKIYEGDSIVDLIGPYDMQIPQIRYRLVSVLQNLIESDQNMFVHQGRAILESSQIHYYFKCTVFEVIGQCDAPDESVFALVDQYVSQQEWTNYIVQVVYYGHPAFVEHLSIQGCDWFEETNLSLLKSISSDNPEFVIKILLSYNSDNIEDAKKIYWALCFNIDDDSDNMFLFRIELIKKHPVLLEDYWGFPVLFTRNPIRAIQLLKIIVDKSNNQRYKRIYFGEKKDVNLFVANNYESIITGLFLSIHNETRELTFAWPFHKYSVDEKKREWIRDDYDKSVLRSIVEITKSAAAEYANRMPEKFCAFIEQYSHSSSSICHEIISYAISFLPESYANYVIQWLLCDFNLKVFAFTGDQKDYLSYAKQIISKFSPSCSSVLFQQIEHTIINWKDSSEMMCKIYKHRIEINNSKQHPPVYYAFWGHMQKELLPCLDPSRLSRYSLELIQVLKRNTWIQATHYSSGIDVGSAKFVVSPVEQYAERISDTRWLKIINTPSDKMESHWQGTDDGSNYIEANHWAFSQSFRKQAKREPARFANLSLYFPNECYAGYVLAVLSALEDDRSEVDLALTCQVIRHSRVNPDPNVAIFISRIIERRAKEPWPDDILDMVAAIATTHADPEGDGFSITSNDDPEHLTIRSLNENAINCARGCALHAISALLWENNEIGSRFKSVISTASEDKNPAVRFAVSSCLGPYYNSDHSFAITVLKKLLNEDLRIIGAHGFWELMSQDYSNDQQYYYQKLLSACRSKVSDLSVVSAGILCAVAIYLDDKQAFNTITSVELSTEQQNRICNQAISSFNSSEYHSRSKDILLSIICNATEQLHNLSHLFLDNTISIQRDADFLIILMKSAQSHELLHWFLNYLKDFNGDICQFADILRTMSESLMNSPDSWRRRMDVQDFVQCVIQLSDRGKENSIVQEICLEIWDNLFRSNLKDIKPLSDMIDNFE